MPIRFLDLFAGAGGLSHGLVDAGLKCVYSNEIDPVFCETFKKNHKNVFVDNQDITKINIRENFKKYKDVELVVGGPPCQGFSQKGSRKELMMKEIFYSKNLSML